MEQSEVDTLFEEIENGVDIPRDAVYLLRLQQLKDLLTFINVSIRPNVDGDPDLRGVCAIVVNNRNAIGALANEYPFGAIHLKKYFAP